MIRVLTKQDIKAWLNLATEVEHLFGKMVGVKEFEEGIEFAINDGCVFGFEDEMGRITGVTAISKEHNSIEWLAVAESAKGKGIGKLLIEKSLEMLDQSKNIFVQTFSAEIPEGLAARKLYDKFGFIDSEPGGLNPAGINTVIMKRNPLSTI